jgi:hypothetical protein
VERNVETDLMIARNPITIGITCICIWTCRPPKTKRFRLGTASRKRASMSASTSRPSSGLPRLANSGCLATLVIKSITKPRSPQCAELPPRSCQAQQRRPGIAMDDLDGARTGEVIGAEFKGRIDGNRQSPCRSVEHTAARRRRSSIKMHRGELTKAEFADPADLSEPPTGE